jgi:hypothetical protein
MQKSALMLFRHLSYTPKNVEFVSVLQIRQLKNWYS